MEKKLKAGRKPVNVDEKKRPVSIYINAVEKTQLIKRYGSITNAVKYLFNNLNNETNEK